jgi:hypothetical protein
MQLVRTVLHWVVLYSTGSYHFSLGRTVLHWVVLGLSRTTQSLTRCSPAAGLFSTGHPQATSAAVHGRGAIPPPSQPHRSNTMRAAQATAALDQKTEAQFHRVLETQFAKTTIICVAHRVENLQWCDMRVEMAQGRVASISALRK